MNAVGTCKFCKKQSEIEMYEFNCLDCNVKYLTRAGDDIFWMSFQFSDDKIYSFVTNLSDEQTTIWLVPPGRNMKGIHIDQIWPDITPQEALQLAKRLYKLKAFL